MSVIPCNLGVARWNHPAHWGIFQPHGPLHHEGAPTTGLAGKAWVEQESWAARLFVGFNVGRAPTWSMTDLIPLVRAVRTRQTRTGEEDKYGDPNATFIAQKGVYKHKEPTYGVVEEDGAQVIIFATSGETSAIFEARMVALGEEIARQLHQELVIVEIQRNGVVQSTIGVDTK